MQAAAPEDVLGAAEKLGFIVPSGHEDDYLELLRKTDAACQTILAEPDYKPAVDYERWPRTNVHRPVAEANPSKAWAWRAEAGDPLESSGKILSGKTVVFKDTICMAGVPLLFGTDAFEGYIPDVDATVVTRVLENGGHILGKATCENFSHGATSSSSAYGPVENPYAVGFSTGGSSSGCGGLIGSGEVDMGVGGDQGGSIRIPASCCGIVGLKPTFGLVPYTGVLSSAASVDHVGPMARTVLDTAALLQATAGYDKLDDRQLGAPLPAQLPDYIAAAKTTDIKGLRVGVLKEAFSMKLVTPTVAALTKAAAAQLAALGAIVEEVSVPTFTLTNPINHIVNKFESGGTRQGKAIGRRGLFINGYWDALLPWEPAKYDKAKYFVTGTAMSSEYGWLKYPTAYGRAINLARRMIDEFEAVFEKYDVVIMPTCPEPPRRHIPAHAGPLGWAEHAPGAASITAATNLTGHPSMTIPVGFSAPMPDDITCEADKVVKLPVGLMIAGKKFDEATILRVGAAYEASVDWKTLGV